MFRIIVEVEIEPFVWEYGEDDAIDSIIKELEDGVDLGYFQSCRNHAAQWHRRRISLLA